MSFNRLAVFAITLSIGSVSSVHAAAIIDTATHWGGQVVGTWGQPPQTATHGQTFTVGSDTRLDSFTYYVAHDSAYDPLTFAAYVMEWSPTEEHAVGPVLFQSDVLHSASGIALLPLTVVTGGLQLIEGHQYIAFFSTSIVSSGNGRGWLGYAGEAYGGGEFAYIANGTDFAALTTARWVTGYPDVGGDLAFAMAFNIPEPTALSERMRTRPISPVCATCVPPQSSTE